MQAMIIIIPTGVKLLNCKETNKYKLNQDAWVFLKRFRCPVLGSYTRAYRTFK